MHPGVPTDARAARGPHRVAMRGQKIRKATRSASARGHENPPRSHPRSAACLPWPPSGARRPGSTCPAPRRIRPRRRRAPGPLGAQPLSPGNQTRSGPGSWPGKSRAPGCSPRPPAPGREAQPRLPGASGAAAAERPGGTLAPARCGVPPAACHLRRATCAVPPAPCHLRPATCTVRRGAARPGPQVGVRPAVARWRAPPQ